MLKQNSRSVELGNISDVDDLVSNKTPETAAHLLVAFGTRAAEVKSLIWDRLYSCMILLDKQKQRTKTQGRAY